MFKASLKRVMIRIRVGKVVKSVGFGMYSEIKIIKTEIDKEMTRKKSSMTLGSGTMMMAKIEIIKITMVKSFDLIIGSKKGAILSRSPF